jgi:hypothetical protein
MEDERLGEKRGTEIEGEGLERGREGVKVNEGREIEREMERG